MDRWNATDAAFGRLGFDPTGVRGAPSGRSGDPTGVGGYEYGSLGRLGQARGFDPLLDFGMNAMADQIAKRQAAEGQFGNFYGGQPGGSGPMTSLGGSWENIDQWNPQIQAAAAKYGVPGNLIKSVMKLESGGVNAGRNGAGAIGLMQVVDRFWGGLGYDLYDPAQNVMAGAHVLRQFYDQYKDWALQNGVDPWKAAVYSYYAGNPYNLSARDDPAQGGSGMTTGAYGDQIWRDYMALSQSTPGMGAGPSFNPGNFGGGAGSGNFGAFLPNSALPSWGEFDQESSLPYYGYGRDYGLSGTTHTGLDITMPFGQPMKAAFSGTVRCAGTGPGCDAFGYVPNFGGAGSAMPGAGRIEIVSDDGNTVLIYGHSAGSAVRAGQRVNAGDVVGYNGGMNSAHVHLEARVRDPSTASGWRIVDPRTVLGGGVPGMGGVGGGFAPAPPQGQAGYDWGNAALNFLLNKGQTW